MLENVKSFYSEGDDYELVFSSILFSASFFIMLGSIILLFENLYKLPLILLPVLATFSGTTFFFWSKKIKGQNKLSLKQKVLFGGEVVLCFVILLVVL